MLQISNKAKLSTKNIIDPIGGTFKAGYISNVSLITLGQAQGHGLWIDSVFLQQVVQAVSKRQNGLKAKFMHASLFSDSIGTFLGKVVNVRIEGNQVLGDLSFAESATKTRYGNLADYILTMARETPQEFGASIQFDLNIPDMIAFVQSKGGEAMVDENGQLQVSGFQSPDQTNGNVNNYPHARLNDVTAVSMVDEPAANPNGLFATKFSQIREEVVVIANLIKMEIENKQNIGILKELSKMNINLAKEVVAEQKSVEQTQTTVMGETQVINKEQTVVVTVEETPTEVIVQTTTVEKEKIEKPVSEDVANQVVKEELKSQNTSVVLSAKDTEIEQLKAMVQSLQTQFAKQKELINFASGTIPVAPVVQKEFKSGGLRQKFEKALKKQ